MSTVELENDLPTPQPHDGIAVDADNGASDASDSLASFPASRSATPGELNRFTAAPAPLQPPAGPQSAASTTSFDESSASFVFAPPAVVTTTVYRRVRMTREEAYRRAAEIRAARRLEPE
uniref:Uncharacterized protein n=1 Tax=Neobodo designis TaxID=312471 RepID=A0A7S1QMJ0_NEODS